MKALLVVVSVGAVAATVVVLVTRRLDVALALGWLAAAAVGYVVGRLLSTATPPQDAPPMRPPSPAPSTMGGIDRSAAHDMLDPAQAGPDDDSSPVTADALVHFAQELVAATTMERFRRVVSSHLPTLLGTRTLWIASRTPRGRQVVVPDPSEAAPDLLDGEGREWTTFALRVDHENVGILGIETSGGVKPRVRRLMHLAAPMIAQAMVTAQSIEALRETSRVDLLTGLATRAEGAARLDSEVKRSQRSGAPMAVLMLDLDRFKSVNDRFGHDVGDAMLGVVGRTIMRVLRASDIRVRWGGEEFLVVLPETDLARAQVAAAGLLREIAASTVATPSGAIGSSVSIGITISRPGETDAAAMIRRADMALYHAKAAGRGCVRVVLGDRAGQPLPVNPPAAPEEPGPRAPLTFSDRRDPHRPDRRQVRSPGRRATDPQPRGGVLRDDLVAGEVASMRTSNR